MQAFERVMAFFGLALLFVFLLSLASPAKAKGASSLLNAASGTLNTAFSNVRQA